MSGVLYLSYSGMYEPLGQSQVLSYLERLARRFDVHLISFEKADHAANPDAAAVRERIRAARVGWHPLRYHARPSALATAYDVVQGIRLGRSLIKRHGLQLVHARSYVPSLMALALKRDLGVRYLFDMRGFWPDERVDGGLWPRNGAMYRLVKRLERKFLLSADAIVSLTHAAAEEIDRFRYMQGRRTPVHVIPTCADLDRFSPASSPPGTGPFMLGYVGTVGNWYRFDEALDCFVELKRERPESRMLVVNRDEHDLVRALAAARGVTDLEVSGASHAQMPNFIRRMSAGIMIAKPAYSHLARAPTRLAEFLGCGVPCLSNDGIGDVTRILEDHGVGVVLRSGEPEAKRNAMARLAALAADPDTRARCRTAALRLFSVEAGTDRYAEIYRSLGVR